MGVRIRVQYSDSDLPGLVRIIRASHPNDVQCPRWRGQSQEDDYRTEVRFKDKNLLKIKVFSSSGSHRVPDPRIADRGLGSGPKSGFGLNRWHQSGETDPRLVAGSDPDCVTIHRDWDTTYVGTGPDQLPLAKDGKKKANFTRKDRKATHQRTHLIQRKEVRIAFAFTFAFAFALHLSF